MRTCEINQEQKELTMSDQQKKSNFSNKRNRESEQTTIQQKKSNTPTKDFLIEIQKVQTPTSLKEKPTKNPKSIHHKPPKSQNLITSKFKDQQTQKTKSEKKLTKQSSSMV